MHVTILKFRFGYLSFSPSQSLHCLSPSLSIYLMSMQCCGKKKCSVFYIEFIDHSSAWCMHFTHMVFSFQVSRIHLAELGFFLDKRH
jgi:hypothetical protein